MMSDDMSNKTKIWGIAAAVGVLAFLLLKFAASYSFWPALLLALLIGVLVAILLWIGFFRDPEELPADAQQPRANLASGTMSTGTTGIAAPPTVTDPPAAAPAADAKLADAAKPAKAKAAAAKTAKTATKPKATAQPAASDKPKTTAKKAAKPAKAKAGDAATAKAPAAKKPATKPAAKAAAKPVAADGKPDLLTAAREGGPDDLKQIKGVGPKLEAELHKVGVYHFDQVAAWRKKEVTWMDENLAGVRNRVSRDDWVSQAKILAKGGHTEFSKRVTKGDVY